MADFPPPIDFSALDPTSDANAFDERVRAIMSDAAIGQRRDVLAQLGSWLTPALLAAAGIAIVAAIPLLRQPSPSRRASSAEMLGIPTAVADLARSTSQPGVVDLVEALGLERSHVR